MSQAKVKAVRNYKKKSKDELSFKKGQVINITTRRDDTHQLHGEYMGSKGVKLGWFPQDTIRTLTDKEVEELVRLFERYNPLECN